MTENLPAASPSPALTIRLADAAELPQIAELLVTAYDADYAPLSDSYLQRLSRPQDRVAEEDIWFGADADGSLIATLSTSRTLAEDGAAWCSLLAVAPSARRRGLGRQLLTAAVNNARRLGATRLGLHSATYMTGAHRLYREFGFVRTPEGDFEVLESENPVTVWAFSLPLTDET
ncbi:MAG: GNAT family N-acetyltransferase [Mycetocola sp.]